MEYIGCENNELGCGRYDLDGKITRADGMELARSIAGWKDTETAEQCIVSFLLLHDNLVNNADLFHDVIIPAGNTVSRPADPLSEYAAFEG